jgi:hypothetical protein
MVDGVLYMWVRNLNKDGTGSSLAWSKDGAKTWIWADWSFPEIGYPVWMNAGRNYEAAEDGYAYMYSPDTPSAYKTSDHILLARVPKDQIAKKANYEFFAGTDGNGMPQWTPDYQNRKPVFTDPGHCYRPEVVYNPGLKRYLLCTATSGSVQWCGTDEKYLGIFDAPHPWGPWTVVKQIDGWGGEENRFQPRIPAKWVSEDGTSFYLLYSCFPKGRYQFNVQEVSIKTADERLPTFRWDTVPVWLRVRKSTAYSDAEIAQIARYPLVVFEKANGHLTYGDVESGTLAAARAVKKISQTTKTIFYFNAVIEYPNYRANEEFDENAERWAVRKGGKIFKFKGRYHIHDLAQADVRQWWVKTATDMAGHPEIDGVFIDAVCKVPGYGDAYAAGYWEMARKLRSSLSPGKLLLANAVRASEPNSNLDHLTYLDGSYVERWAVPMHGERYESYVAKSIEAMSKMVKEGKLLLFSAGPGAFGREGSVAGKRPPDEMRRWMRENIDYPLGVFLLVAGEHSYFEWTHTPDALLGALSDHNYDEYRKPLGKPLSEAEKNGYFYTRRFEHLDVRVDIKEKKAVLNWH